MNFLAQFMLFLYLCIEINEDENDDDDVDENDDEDRKWDSELARLSTYGAQEMVNGKCEM